MSYPFQGLTPDEYQRGCEQTAIYPHGEYLNAEQRQRLIDNTGLFYVTLGLNGEAGEVAEMVKKFIRDGNLDKERLKKELGDVCWYLAMSCREAGFDFSEVLEANLAKLQKRKEDGTLRGEGSDR